MSTLRIIHYTWATLLSRSLRQIGHFFQCVPSSTVWTFAHPLAVLTTTLLTDVFYAWFSHLFLDKANSVLLVTFSCVDMPI